MKILISNGAHIGDVILTTSLLPALKKEFPNGQIGMLVGSWALDVVKEHRLIDHIHIYDQACINRSKKKKKEKKRQELLTWNQAMGEVKAINYEVAFDLYTFYKKNAGHFLFQSQIKERIAYWSCVAPFFYNRHLFWNYKDLHMVENYRIFLTKWGVSSANIKEMTPQLEYTKLPDVKSLLPVKDYLVIHMGVGDLRRAWNLSSWKELICLLKQLDLPLVFVGKGDYEKAQVEEVIPLCSFAINLVNLISWQELVVIIKQARLLIGLESMAGHVAAAVDTHAVLIYGGSVPIHRWRPFSPKSTVVCPEKRYFHPVEQKAPLSAIHTILAKEVFEKVHAVLSELI